MLLHRRLPGARAKISRHVAERRNAQGLGDELELGVPFDRLRHRPRQADVVADHRSVTRGARLEVHMRELKFECVGTQAGATARTLTSTNRK